MSDLDKDFVKLAAQINNKLEEAAKALQEAAKLATQAGLPSLVNGQYLWDDLSYRNRMSDSPKTKEEVSANYKEIQSKLEQIDVSEFEDAMGECGWSASSSYC